MNDIKFGHLKPIGQPAAPEKGVRKGPAGDNNFSQTLESAVTKMNEASNRVDNSPTIKDAMAARKQLEEANADLAKMMQVERQLRELHQKVTQPPKDNS